MNRSFSPMFHRHALIASAMMAAVGIGAALAETTPSSVQPTLPERKPGSPVVESLVGQPAPLEVRKYASVRPRHRIVRHARIHRAPPDLDRPALAGIELLAPLPRPGEPPHLVVPLPAYALDSVVTPFLTPAPPVVCHDVRREPTLPDPHLYREVTVACEPDNP